MVDWKKVKRLVIPDGVVMQIICGGVILWGGSWEEPVQTGDALYITNVFAANQSGSTIAIE